MDTEKFIGVVRRMREAQREYFKTRNNIILFRAKSLEQIVDEMIQEHDAWLKNHPRQHDLFDNQ